MLAYEPDDTLAHRLDPRSKLAVQLGFSITAIAHTDPVALVVLTGLTLVFLWSGGVSVPRAIYTYRFALPFLCLAPLVAGLTLGAPWFDVADAGESARASYRVFLIILVSAAYIRSTPVRDSRAAIQRTVPGKPGQVLGMGVAMLLRFVPLLQADLRTIRDASAARLGTERSLKDRIVHLGTASLERAFTRADRLALALQARCFAWNPTLPPLSMSRLDWPVVGFSLILAFSALL